MRIYLLGLTLIAMSCASKPAPAPAKAPAPAPLPSTLNEAIESSYRTPENKNRDIYRHPLQTLTFFDIQPNMTVIEIWPAMGWYTEILAPYLTSSGHYVAAVSHKQHPEVQAGNDKMQAWLAAHANVKVDFAEFQPPVKMELPPASADRVITFRNVHNWMMDGHYEQAAFKSFFKALKPGGVLGIVEHRASTNAKNVKPDTGYVYEKEVIKLAKKAGFQFLGKSEINANSKDTKDYPNGVWTLPPSNKHDAKDDAKYKAIGESDRMTLKFLKPAP